MRTNRVRSAVSILLIVAVALMAHSLLAAGDATVNSDFQLASYNSSLVYRVFISAAPTTFEPMKFMDKLLAVYQSGFSSSQFPSVSSLRLRSWCGWPNTTYVSTARYCDTGAGLVDAYTHVFLEYTVNPVGVTVTDKSLAAYGVVSLSGLDVVSNNGVPYAVTVLETTNLLFNPDTFRGNGYGFTEVVVQNTVVMWVVFAIVVAVFVGIIVGCCCWCRRRDRAWGKKNHDMVRSLFTGFRLHHGSTSQVIYDSASQRQGRGDGIGASRYRDANGVGGYDVYSPDVDGTDTGAGGYGRGETASPPATSRASEFWPGSVTKTSSVNSRTRDHEMEERPFGSTGRLH